MSGLVLRPARPDELPAVLAFWTVAAENGHRPADSAAAVEALHRRDPEALILALDGDDLVGTVIAGWDGWRCHLYRLAVAPDRRRSGIGRALVAAAEERFRAFGGARADAMVLDENGPAWAVWSGRGYRRQDEWSRWVKSLA